MDARDSHFSRVQRIAIIGTGLLGGSMGLGLKTAGFKGKITGVGRRMESARLAQERGCIDEASTDVVKAAADAELVVLATPISMFVPLFTMLQKDGRVDRVITNVGSTKRWVCDKAAELLPAARARYFVGSHPMAGSERRGPEAAIADLFHGKPCILTPDKSTDAAATEMVRALWKTLGMKIVEMTPEKHDHAVAQISHLPHAVAAMLVQAATPEAMSVASSGFLSTTRVASGDSEVWTDVFMTNRQAMTSVLRQFKGVLEQFEKMIERGDAGAIREFLNQSKTTRDAWVKNFDEDES